MSKYVIKFEDNPWYQDDGVGYYKCGEIPWWSAKKSDIKKLTPLDKELDDAYQKGLEEGKKQAKVQAHLDVCHDIERVAHGNYQKGLDDAWEAARKICLGKEDGGISNGELLEIFKVGSDYSALKKYSASEALAKLREYEQQKVDAEIKVGDEVRNTLGLMDNAVGYFFGDSSDGCNKVLRYVDGKFKTGIWNKENCERTGKHSYAVERMVAVMKEGAE